MIQLNESERAAGLVSASAGNHAQGLGLRLQHHVLLSIPWASMARIA